VAVLACAAIGVAVHGSVEQKMLAQALAEQDSALASNQAATPNVMQSAEHHTLSRTVAQREALLAALQRETPGPINPAQTLASVVQALPATVWLNELELLGAQRLRITGGTLDPQALALYAHQLSRAPSLRGTVLQTVRLEAGMEAVIDAAAASSTHIVWPSSTAPARPGTPATARGHHQFELASAPVATGAQP
jgi:hypothetical protein